MQRGSNIQAFLDHCAKKEVRKTLLLTGKIESMRNEGHQIHLPRPLNDGGSEVEYWGSSHYSATDVVTIVGLSFAPPGSRSAFCVEICTK